MKVLLINGSPHVAGCTFTALSEVASQLGKHGIETRMFHIGNRPIQDCTACGACAKTGQCVFKDDAVNECIDLLKASDGLVVGSPVYFAGPVGQITSFLDRMFFMKSGAYAHKPAAAVVSCRRGGASASFDRLNKYFTIARMPVVSSQYWNSVHGRLPGEAAQDAEGLQTMRTLARNMTFLMKSIALGKAKYGLPEKEERVGTNFIR